MKAAVNGGARGREGQGAEGGRMADNTGYNAQRCCCDCTAAPAAAAAAPAAATAGAERSSSADVAACAVG